MESPFTDYIGRTTQDNEYAVITDYSPLDEHEVWKQLDAALGETDMEDFVTVHTPTCNLDPSQMNKIGFEFDMLLNITADLKKTQTITDKTLISTHTEASDGFILKIDGNKIEVSTKPFELSAAGLTDLKNSFARIEKWISDVKSSLRTQKKIVRIKKDPACTSCISGDGIYLETATVGSTLKIAPAFISPGHFMLPLKTAKTIKDDYFTAGTDIRGVPQATMGVPLASINQLTDIIRSRQGGRVGEGLTGTTAMRLGLRSDALFNAQQRVNTARKFFLQQGSFGSLKITTENFSNSLTGFLILMAEYLWTSVLPIDSRDWEGFSKAYVPLHSKTRFREMFHCLLNDKERELFIKVFWEADSWKNLFSLTKPISGKKGGYTDIDATPDIRLFPSTVVATEPTWKAFVQSVVENNFLVEQTSGADTLVTNPTKAIPLTVEGAIVEFRRMGFGTISSSQWRNMALRLFSIAQKLNDKTKLTREAEYEYNEIQDEEPPHEDSLDDEEYDPENYAEDNQDNETLMQEEQEDNFSMQVDSENFVENVYEQYNEIEKAEEIKALSELDEELQNEVSYLLERNESEQQSYTPIEKEFDHFLPEADPVLFYEDVKIRPGETLIGLAAEYGFDPDDWLEIWNDPKNAALKTKRRLSTNIRAGDVVFFPIKWRITSGKKMIPFASRFIMQAERSGKEGVRLDWVQTVFGHNQPNFPSGPFPAFSVDLPTEDDLPFYWTQENYDHLTRNDAGTVIKIFRKKITDVPNRPAPTLAQGPTKWRAVTSLCVNTHKRVSIWNTFVWGVNFNPDGVNTVYEIRPATQDEINGHLNLLRKKTGRSKKTYSAMGWTFRDKNNIA